MARIAIVLILIAVGAGCGASSRSADDQARSVGDFARHDNDPAPYLTGFMEGYAAARPDQRIGSTDSPASQAERHKRYRKTEVFGHGWRDGYRTGADDAKQAE
jgi:hypothetical protein